MESVIEKQQVIDSLLDQARDKDSLVGGDEDSIFADDAEALRAAADMLSASMPKVLTQEELETLPPYSVVWLEEHTEERDYIHPMIKYSDGFFENRHLAATPDAAKSPSKRFWSALPSHEQRSATVWKSVRSVMVDERAM